MKVLLLEDNDSLREAMGWTLAWAGHEVVSFARGQDALAYLSIHTVELVVMDWNMPSMSGAEFLARAQSLFLPLFTPRVAVVSGDSWAASDARRMGASHFIAKPVGPEQLLAV